MPDQQQINNLDNLSEEDKIKVAKETVSEYLHIMEKLSDEEKKILSKALEDIEDDNIAKIKQQIMQID